MKIKALRIGFDEIGVGRVEPRELPVHSLHQAFTRATDVPANWQRRLRKRAMKRCRTVRSRPDTFLGWVLNEERLPIMEPLVYTNIDQLVKAFTTGYLTPVGGSELLIKWGLASKSGEFAPSRIVRMRSFLELMHVFPTGLLETAGLFNLRLDDEGVFRRRKAETEETEGEEDSEDAIATLLYTGNANESKYSGYQRIVAVPIQVNHPGGASIRRARWLMEIDVDAGEPRPFRSRLSSTSAFLYFDGISAMAYETLNAIPQEIVEDLERSGTILKVPRNQLQAPVTYSARWVMRVPKDYRRKQLKKKEHKIELKTLDESLTRPGLVALPALAVVQLSPLLERLDEETTISVLNTLPQKALEKVDTSLTRELILCERRSPFDAPLAGVRKTRQLSFWEETP
jgi:hypothetical protein